MFSGVNEVVIDEGDVVDWLPQPEYSSAGEYSFVGDEVLLGVIFVLSFVDPAHEQEGVLEGFHELILGAEIKPVSEVCYIF